MTAEVRIPQASGSILGPDASEPAVTVPNDTYDYECIERRLRTFSELVAARDSSRRPAGHLFGPGLDLRVTGWWGALSVLAFAWNNFRAVLVTDHRIVVLDCGQLRMGTPKAVVRELPRNIRIGPPSGLWWKCESLGEKLYVHKRFHKDVAAADAALGW